MIQVDPLFDITFPVIVPKIALYDDRDIEFMDKTYITSGGKNINADGSITDTTTSLTDCLKQNMKSYQSVAKLIKIYNNGLDIHFVNHSDIPKVFKIMQERINYYKNLNTINGQEVPEYELGLLDRYAQYLYDTYYNLIVKTIVNEETRQTSGFSYNRLMTGKTKEELAETPKNIPRVKFEPSDKGYDKYSLKDLFGDLDEKY
jgi:hypothetical protein